MLEDLTGLTTFVTVAERRSFTSAAEALGVSRSAVSHTVRQLEQRLGVRLLQRTTRSVALTEAGERLVRALSPALVDVRAALQGLEDLKSRPSGILRVSVSSIAEELLSQSTLAEFLAAYPDIRLDLHVEDVPRDIIARGFDAGIQLGEVVARDMVAVPISREQRQLVAGSPAYLAAHGVPKHPRDLQAHACIVWRAAPEAPPYRWEFTEGERDFEVAVDARVYTNDKHVKLRLARDGVGLIMGMEEYLRPSLLSGELVAVLEKYCPFFPGFFLYHPSRTQMPPKLRAFIDFLRRRMHARPRGKGPR